MGKRAAALAERIEQGARHLLAAAAAFSAADWRTACPDDGRTVGVLVHHVASAYPVEVELITTALTGGPLVEITSAEVARLNAEHAGANAGCDKAETLALLRRNSAAAAAVVRGLDDEQLDRTAPTVLHLAAPLTVQYLIEQHPIAHPYIHLESIRTALGATGP